jgi:hypothetical protein
MKMDLGNIVWEDVDWIYVAQERDWWQAVVNSVIILWIP